MNVLDLFSGIGGFSLGLERAGMRTVAFCEIDPYCRAVLRKHWPDVPIHEDVRELGPASADIITAGWPCQDISNAGSRTGLAGERSGLWREVVRAIRLVRPVWAVLENVAALCNRGMGEVLGDLAEIGLDAEWDCIPTGFPCGHRRERILIVANARGQGLSLGSNANAFCGHAEGVFTRERFARFLKASIPAQIWADRPLLGREIHGVSGRTHRLRALGNAVVPQVVEQIGRAIMRAA